jgi:hypothetical protein
LNELIDKFIEYATFNDEGDINGISKDAPISAKEAYLDYMTQLAEAKSKGLKI